MRKISNKNLNNNLEYLEYFAPENIRAPAVSAFATRLGGVSGISNDSGDTGETGDYVRSLNLGFKEKCDSNENVLQNYRIIADKLGFSVSNIIYAHQKHTDNILVCDKSFLLRSIPSLPLPADYIYDAMITDIPGILLSVKSADCVPVLFWDEEHNAVGAAHCGWRGTIEKLQVKTAVKMRELYNTDLRRLKVAVGPCISKCCYEVSGEFFDNFVNTLGSEVKVYFDEKPGGKYHCDLKGINKMLLENTLDPVNPDNIEISRNCTCCEKNLFYSHRRQGEFRGTHASFIGLRNQKI